MHPAGFEPAKSPIMSWELLPLSHGCKNWSRILSIICYPLHFQGSIAYLTSMQKSATLSDTIARIAQLVEQRTENPRVTSSNLVLGKGNLPSSFRRAKPA
jgi:hypothetical protein